MEKIFESMIDDYLLNNLGISEEFLSFGLATQLKDNLQSLYASNHLISAKTGLGNTSNQDLLIRKDKIFWLDKIHENEAENAFFDVIDSFVIFLNKTCYTGITSYEFHYALYEKGSFYKKHKDQFKDNASRQYTLIFYLNTDWKTTDGGELCVYLNDLPLLISPTNGKSVFFKSSELVHEVLRSNTQRMSITGWLRID